MEAHLEREGEEDADNHRKRVLTDSGTMDLEVLRDRLGKFEPQLVEKYARRLPSFDDKVISMRAAWRRVFGTGGRSRGTGFPEAIESVYPEAVVQTCIVHLIRHSLAYAL